MKEGREIWIVAKPVGATPAANEDAHRVSLRVDSIFPVFFCVSFHVCLVCVCLFIVYSLLSSSLRSSIFSLFLYSSSSSLILFSLFSYCQKRFCRVLPVYTTLAQ